MFVCVCVCMGFMVIYYFTNDSTKYTHMPLYQVHLPSTGLDPLYLQNCLNSSLHHHQQPEPLRQVRMIHAFMFFTPNSDPTI